MLKPDFNVEQERDRMARNQLSKAVHSILENQNADARAKQGSGYWGQGSNNVGDAVFRAVHRIEMALLGLEKPVLTLEECREILEVVRVENENDPEDEYGFGAATYRAILDGIDALIRRVGPEKVFSGKNAVSGNIEV